MGVKTRYVRCDGARIAYQVFGAGPVDLVFVPGFVSHVELQWADPLYARFLRRLGSLARVVIYDKRGVGMSDRVDGPVSVQQHAADLARVMDAAGVDRAVMLGFSDGAAAAAVHAMCFPHRVTGLLFVAGFLPTQGSADAAARAVANAAPLADRWGDGVSLELTAPSLAGSRLNRSNYAMFERMSVSREGIAHVIDANGSLDLTDVLPAIQVPTLFLHRSHDYVPIEIAREAAKLVPTATLVDLSGADHVPFAGDANRILVHVEDFVSRVRDHPQQTPEHAAVVFTDIVGSTQTLVALGDRQWRDMVQAHDELTIAEAERFGGCCLQSTGDGWRAVFATAASAARFAAAVVEQVPRVDLQLRAGIHAGPVERDGDDVRGLTVHAAARIAGRAKPGEVLCSADTVRRCFDAGIEWERRGSFALKGLPGRWVLHRVVEVPPHDPPAAVPSDQMRVGAADRAVSGLARRVPVLARGLGRFARPRPLAGAS